jgi:hypothetical protein
LDSPPGRAPAHAYDVSKARSEGKDHRDASRAVLIAWRLVTLGVRALLNIYQFTHEAFGAGPMHWFDASLSKPRQSSKCASRASRLTLG